jgi:hypothetical protein
MGTPDMATRLPLETSISQPALLLCRSAMLVGSTPLPGRKAIAQGVLKLVHGR